jgi:prolyl oligopeptidase
LFFRRALDAPLARSLLNRSFISVLISVTFIMLLSCTQPIKYPIAREVDITDNYHGIQVKDPYRWLEDLTSNEVEAWVDDQNNFASPYFDNPFRNRVASTLERIWNSETHSIPFSVAGKTFYYFNDGSWQQSKLMIKTTNDSSANTLLDPNAFSDDGTFSLGGVSISPNGKYLAYSLSDGGSDWQVWRVLDIDTREHLQDELRWSKFSGAEWTLDSTAFYYTKYPEPNDELSDINLSPEIRLHIIGQDQIEDALIINNPADPKLSWSIMLSDDGLYKVLSTIFGTDDRNLIGVAKKGHDFIPIVTELKAKYSFISSHENQLWFYTNDGAPKGKIVMLDIDKIDLGFTDVINEASDSISSYTMLAGNFIVSYLVDTFTHVKYFDEQGMDQGYLGLTIPGSVTGFDGKRQDTTTYYSVTNFIQPTQIYQLDLMTNQSTLYWEEILKDYDPSQYTSRLVFYPSKDGTMIPIHINYRSDALPNEGTPVLLYGYGGFNISLLPRFSKSFLSWMEQGGVFAIVNLRGGGEYGSQWHEQGMLLNKQNVFDDFAYAAKYLHSQSIGSPKSTTIQGGSNGGLLVAAALLQNPNLFGFAIPQVGVLDMLRFNQFTIGWAWESDYGSPQDVTHFENLLSYSPYHNVVDGVCYPPTLITTSDRDDRVVPAHSYKFAARLQAAQGCGSPILLRVETRAGHGAGTPRDKVIKQLSEIYGLALTYTSAKE